MVGTFLFTFLTFLVTQAQAGRPLGRILNDDSLTQCLKNVVGSTAVILPGDAAYANATLVFDRAFQNYPVAIAYPKSTSDVQGIVLCSRAAGVQAVPRSGGHSYEGYCVITGTVLVDLTNLDFFTPSPDHTTAQVGTGNRLGPIYYKAWTQTQRVFPAGLCPYVGAGGHILGGGVGLLTRKYGLACDQLTEVEMVLYNGTIVTANSAQHPELLFASRGGGGGNFGIVTSYTLNLLDPGNSGDVILFQVDFGADQYSGITAFLKIIQNWAPNAPEELSIQVFLGDSGYHVLGVYVGTEADFLPVFQSSGLTNLPGASPANFSPFNNSFYLTIPYIEAALYFGQYTMGLAGTGTITDLLLGPDTKLTYPPGPSKSKSNILYDPISDAGLAVIQQYIQSSTPPSYLEFNSLGGYMATIGPHDTAYPHRGGIFDLQFQVGWDSGNSAQQASQLAWLNNFYDALQPYVGQPRAYVNYIDNELPNYLNLYFDDNLPRLEQVKAAYDPLNYFNNPQSIPLPSSPPSSPPEPQPTTCDPYSSQPNQCFNADGTAFTCCSGACPTTPETTPDCADVQPTDPSPNPPAPTPNPPPPNPNPPAPSPNPPAPNPNPPSSTTCDPYSATPNQCFNAHGTAFTCCSGSCPTTPGATPTCS